LKAAITTMVGTDPTLEAAATAAPADAADAADPGGAAEAEAAKAARGGGPPKISVQRGCPTVWLVTASQSKGADAA
jgi:hypothetical protein